MGERLNFPRDTERYRNFVRESTEHPAKLEIRTFAWLVEQYTKPGDTILDPMSGIGTVHWAATMGRNTVAIELVPRFVEIQRMNIEKLRTDHGFTSPQEPKLFEGDCRRFLPLSSIGLPSVEAIVFSPPYGSLISGADKGNKLMEEKHIVMTYDEQIANVGNLSVYPQYLEAMKGIYRKCFETTKPGGVLVSVTKDYIKAGRRVWVSRDNLRIMLAAGYVMEDWHTRYTDPKIFQITAQKRREEKGEDKAVLNIDSEDLLVVRKPL